MAAPSAFCPSFGRIRDLPQAPAWPRMDRVPFFRRSKLPTYLTCRGRNDGGGAQIAACISAMIYARQRGLTYAHTPLQDVAHAPTGCTPGDWAARWEQFFSLGEGEADARALAPLPEHQLLKPHRRNPKRGALNIVAHCHKVTDKHPDEWQRIAPEIRRKYAVTQKPDAPKADGRVRISVHLRRGDVGSGGRFSERFTPANRIAPTLRAIVDGLGADRSAVHLYSQGSEGDFEEFWEFAPVFHLDEDVFDSFHGMVTSDVIFTAKSTFSHLAALISEAQVVHEPFWHPPLPGWQSLDQDPEETARRVLKALG